MKKFILLCMLFAGLQTFAQIESAEIKDVDGKKCFVHIVQAGNTLYGIHKYYNVSVDEIVRQNPGVEEGLQIGEVVYVPVPMELVTKEHTVQKGETLFGISRQYKVTVNELIEWNPEVKDGLKEGQIILIKSTVYASVKDQNMDDELPSNENDQETENPFSNAKPIEKENGNPFERVKVTFEDSVVEHVVTNDDTFYSICKRYMVSQDELLEFNGKRNTRIKKGEILKIPLKQERIEKVPFGVIVEDTLQRMDTSLVFAKKESYNVAIMLPFYLNKGKGYNENVERLATEFYMGAEMAIDSLQQNGFSGEVFVYDTRNDSVQIAKLLSNPEFQNMDLIIGPLFKDNIHQVADWAKRNRVRMVCPSTVDTKVLRNNRLVHTAVPSDITLIRGLAKFTAENHATDRILLIKPLSKKDSVLYEAFREAYNQCIDSVPNGSKLIETTSKGFTNYLTRSSEVIIVYPTNNKSEVLKFFNEIGRFIHKTHDDKTFVFGTADWLKFTEVNSFYKNKFKFTFAEGMELDYDDSFTKSQVKKYRKKYNADLSKMAAQGFDVVYSYCNELLLDKKVGKLIMNDFNSEQVGLLHGFENVNYVILSQRDFELINQQR